jgi:hypothetical protein
MMYVNNVYVCIPNANFFVILNPNTTTTRCILHVLVYYCTWNWMWPLLLFNEVAYSTILVGHFLYRTAFVVLFSFNFWFEVSTPPIH